MQFLLQTLICWRDQACYPTECLTFVICLVASVWWCLVCLFPVSPDDWILTKLWIHHGYCLLYPALYQEAYIWLTTVLQWKQPNSFIVYFFLSRVICLVLPWYYKIIWLPINQFIKNCWPLPKSIISFGCFYSFPLVALFLCICLHLNREKSTWARLFANTEGKHKVGNFNCQV